MQKLTQIKVICVLGLTNVCNCTITSKWCSPPLKNPEQCLWNVYVMEELKTAKIKTASEEREGTMWWK